jgi:ferric-dicitrate binding protein FerR (iron transport regulator)
MHNTEELLKIAESLTKYLQGVSSEQDKGIVESWLKKQKNREFYDRLRSSSGDLILKHNNYDLSRARRTLENEFAIKRRQRYYKRIWYAAASIIILIGIYTLFNPFVNTKSSDYKDYTAQFNDFIPGKDQAILSTSGGEKFVIDSTSSSRQIIEKDGTTVQIDGKSVSYKANNKSKSVVYNTIDVPRNGEFKFTLSDGTVVWLNAETKLTFPVSFAGNTREVILDGEAYFEVAHDAQKKFIINTENSVLEVKGTSFNIKAYKGESSITTLVEGRVDLHYKYDKSTAVILKPGDQAIVSGSSNEIEVKQVDTHYFTAWKEGYFAYSETPLDEIMRQLARWYDFEYRFTKMELKDDLFTARLKKYDSPGKIFTVLEETGKVKFKVEKNTIIIY